jgi:3-polyprenyl-4-hydroxybenzoate decarboxylase
MNWEGRVDEPTPASEPHSGFQGEAESVIFQAVQSFYNQPIDSTEIACQSACCVLARIGLPQQDAYVWGAEG